MPCSCGPLYLARLGSVRGVLISPILGLRPEPILGVISPKNDGNTALLFSGLGPKCPLALRLGIGGHAVVAHVRNQRLKAVRVLGPRQPTLSAPRWNTSSQ